MAFDPFPLSAEIGLLLLGFAVGPIFPLLIATTPARFGDAHAANGVGFQISAAALAQALLPWLIGGIARRSSLDVLGPILFALRAALDCATRIAGAAGGERARDRCTLMEAR